MGGTINPPAGSAPREASVSTAAWAIGSAALPSAMIQRGAPPEGKAATRRDRAGAGFTAAVAEA
jgi:hypothetical protein